MVKKVKGKRPKHIPQRTCVGCRQIQEKRTLTRVVRTDTGIVIDQTGKQPGRGAYIHDQKKCWQAAIKGKLANALKTEINDNDRKILLEFMQNLPEIENEEEQDG
jgi:predicted RNA-binding protein YlxR (DUF448 family)